MKISIVLDHTLKRLSLTRIRDEFNRTQSRFRVDVPDIDLDISVDQLDSIDMQETIRRLTSHRHYLKGQNYLILTSKKFPDNFFSKTRRSIKVYSFYSWEYLTSATIEAGILYAVVVQILKAIAPGIKFHEETRGCPLDFKADKRVIDLGIKKGRLCKECRVALQKDANPEDADAILALLDLVAFFAATGRFPRIHEMSPATGKRAEDDMEISLPFVPNESSFYSPSRQKIVELEKLYRSLVEKRENAVSNAEKGLALENFCKCLLGELAGVKLYDCNIRLQNCEIDLSFQVDSQKSDLHKALSPVVFVECKNRSQPASVSDLSHHIMNLVERNLSAGIFISTGGIAGYDPSRKIIRDALAKIVTAYRQLKLLVLPLVWDDIVAIRNGMNLHALLDRKRMEIVHQ